MSQNPSLAKILVHEIQHQLLKDYLSFFDHQAFRDNQWWAGCYCGYYDDPCSDRDWDPSAELGPKHRAARAERIKNNLAHGLLAYVDGKVVGWCNAGPRASYVNLRRYAVAVEDLHERIGSIMCFVVSPAFRQKGVATALLNAACEGFRRDGLLVAEGYPRSRPLKSGESPLPWSASNYHGPLEMFLKAGFAVHRQMEHFAIVRKDLTP